MTCSTSKETQLKEIIFAYQRQLAETHEGVPVEELFPEAVRLARLAFRKDPLMNTFHFNPNTAHPLHCFRLDVLTESTILEAIGSESTERVSQILKAGFATLETLLHAFPYCTLAEYESEVNLLTSNEVATEDQIGLDVTVVHRTFHALSHFQPEITNALLGTLLATSVGQLSKYMAGGSMENANIVQYGPRLQLTGPSLAVRAILILLQIPALFDPTHANSAPLHQLCLAIQRTEAIHFLLTERLSVLPPSIFKNLVVSIQQCISVGLYTNAVFINETIASATSVLSLLYNANYLHRNAGEGIVKYEEFYNGAVNDIIDVRKDFIQYVKSHSAGSKQQGKATFTFAQHPFMLDLTYKSLLLHFHSRVEQEHEVQNTLNALMSAHFLGNLGEAPRLTHDDVSFKLVVDRQNLVRSTMLELATKSDRYKKPLRVHFRGEDGVDEGGLRKEFFQLIVKQIFDPSFGMFDVKDSRVQWFLPRIKCPQNDNEFRLVGLLFGLAIYNSVILDIQFPVVVYKKLLGHDAYLTLADLATLDEPLARGFQTLLDFVEDPVTGLTVENTFCRTFSVEYDVFGSSVVVDLVPNGRNIPLTLANREQYVTLSIRHYLVDSIQQNFDLFKKGFLEVCQNPVLKQIRPTELETLVVGSPVLDFTLLKSVCKYDGYKKTDSTVVHFWEIVLTDLSPDDQRKLLKFSTGSDRVPVGGLGRMSFVIGKNGGDSELLPTAHTCFNHLLLPDYSSKDQLRKKLLQAISNFQGFGLM